MDKQRGKDRWVFNKTIGMIALHEQAAKPRSYNLEPHLLKLVFAPPGFMYLVRIAIMGFYALQHVWSSYY